MRRKTILDPCVLAAVGSRREHGKVPISELWPPWIHRIPVDRAGDSLWLTDELKTLRRAFGKVPAKDLLALWRRRFALPHDRLLPRRDLAPNHEPRLIISLTTMPGRFERIARVLNSLIDQQVPADEIWLAVPEFSRRELRPYVIPSFLRQQAAVKLLACEDWGPATKLIPALMQQSDPHDLVLVVDDDRIYPPDLVARFRNWHRSHPDAALGLRGGTISPVGESLGLRTHFGTEVETPRAVDILMGTWGYLVQGRFFDDRLRDYSGFPPEAFYVDDVWVHGNLARSGVPRLLVPCRLPPLSSTLTRFNGLTFNENRGGGNDGIVMRAFAEYWTRRSQRAEAA